MYRLVVLLLWFAFPAFAQTRGFDVIGDLEHGLPTVGRYRALIIGVNTYRDTKLQLKTPRRDCESLRKLLEEEFGFSDTLMLLDEQATLSNIDNCFRRLAKEAREGDSLLLYFAGHGEVDPFTGAGYWLPYNATKGEYTSYFSNATVQSFIRSYKALHVLLVVDSCYAGALFGETRRAPPTIDQDFYLANYKKNSRWGFTSGDVTPVLDGGGNGHSLFAHHFLKQMREQPGNYFTPQQLYDAIGPIIGNNYDQKLQCRPLVNSGDEGGAFVFIRRKARAVGVKITTQLQYGSLTLHSEAGGALFIDSEKKKDLRPFEKITLENLLAGPHELKITQAGFETVTERVQVRPDQLTEKVYAPAASGQKDLTQARALLDRAVKFYSGMGDGVDEAAAKALFLEAAKSNDPLARMWLARSYFMGRCLFPKDETKGQELARACIAEVKKIAETGEMRASFLLAAALNEGLGLTEDHAQAVVWYTKAAQQGYAPAQLNLGVMYANGKGVAKDEAEAVRWYRKAAEQGQALGQSYLGVGYQNGTGVAKDEAEAVRWFRKAAEQGYALGQSSLGRMYYHGSGVVKDEAEAVRWYRKAAEQGHADSQRNLGRMYESGTGVAKDEVEAVRWYRKAAEQGLADAQNNLGIMYANGKGVDKDDAEAARWYRKAAEQGNAWGQNHLGFMYANGNGVAKYETEAVRWYRKAAEQGLADAQDNLGIMYENGKGVDKDDAEAARWYRKAAEQGNAWGQNHLGFMYANGNGVAKYETEAVRWYRKAAEQGLADAQDNLGIMYANGKGVDKDDAEAARWYRKAAEQGNAYGQCNLGWMYRKGKGVAKDEAEAVCWYRKAAEQGSEFGQINLALCYYNGAGVPKDLKISADWSQKAAKQGNAPAQNFLGYLMEMGLGIKKNISEAITWYQQAARQGDTNAQDNLKRLGKTW